VSTTSRAVHHSRMSRARRQADPEVRRLLEHLPDTARWVEARGMLLSGRGRLAERGPAPGDALLVADDEHLAVITGHPGERELVTAPGHLATVSTLVFPADQESLPDIVRRLLPGWAEGEAVLHELVDARLRALRPPREADVRWLLDPAFCRLEHLPDRLAEELRRAADVSPIAAAFDQGAPVSFCYAAWQTETRWDVSIDTAPFARRRGHAAAAAAFLIEAFARAGKRPVWGAMAGNAASLALARRLGFTPVDVLRVFERLTKYD
jgi:RimJ/RimL family protein N-acetyltransferase